MARIFFVALATLVFVGSVNAQFADSGFVDNGPGTAPEINEYQADDGVAENSLGLTAAGALAWMEKYTVLPNREIITAVRVAFGTPAALNGRPISIHLWSDPNQDGSPADAMSIASVNGVVSGASANPNNPFALFDLPDTLAGNVGQTFFLGVVMQSQLAGEFPAAFDTTDPDPGPGVQWVANAATNALNPNAMSVTDVNSIVVPPPNPPDALRGDWMIRADAIPVPEPTSLGVLGVIGLLALRRY